MHVKRVVVTGMGVISPVGNDIATFFQNITNGVCGIDFIKKFDTTDYKVKVAAEVKDFNAADYMPKPQIRKTDLFCQYALAAAQQAVEDSGIIDNKMCIRDRTIAYTLYWRHSFTKRRLLFIQ